MGEGELIPGQCDVRDWTRGVLLDYCLFLAANAEAWSMWHESRDVPAPAARSLDAEACVAAFGLFRSFFGGLPVRLAPLFHDRPEAALAWRLN